jgi:hypothetical protein
MVDGQNTFNLNSPTPALKRLMGQATFNHQL